MKWFQRLLGDINWLRPYVKLSTSKLRPLFDILRSDLEPRYPRTRTSGAHEALRIVEQTIASQKVTRIDYTKSWLLVFISTNRTPTGCLWQEGPLEWLHLPVSSKKVITSYTDLVVTVILKAWNRNKEYIWSRCFRDYYTLYYWTSNCIVFWIW